MKHDKHNKWLANGSMSVSVIRGQKLFGLIKRQPKTEYNSFVMHKL